MDTSGAKLHLVHQGNRLKGSIICDSISKTQIGGTRQAIITFTARSRKNLIDKLSSLDRDIITSSGAAFLTLTYANRYPTDKDAKIHLRSFMRRLERVVGRKLGFVWRLESQERGAPHFHLLIFGWKKTKSGWPLTFIQFQNLWVDTIGFLYWDYSYVQPLCPYLRINFIREFKALMCYVSKYVAKIEQFSDDPPAESERARSVRASAEDRLRSLFNYSANLYASSFNNFNINDFINKEKELSGRFWGIENRDLIPWAEIREMFIDVNAGLDAVITLLSMKFRVIKPGELQGFTIFSEDSDYWYDRFPDFSNIDDLNVKIIYKSKITLDNLLEMVS
ncbi:MAG: hypothetical protein P9L97_01430 [Candidatus Tenebribacter davisii]|nr:hypothetical protein [Candidatus Tenebribacter davisii]